MKTAFLLIILFSTSTYFAFSQELTGRVVDEKNNAVSNATISLLKIKDSSVVKYAISLANGEFKFTKIPQGIYLINVSSTGFKTKYSFPFHVRDKIILLPQIIITRTIQNIDSVFIISKKPLFKIKPDRIVLNVESSLSTVGSNLMELIQRLPGINVDNDDNISSLGKSGVKVYLDGKKIMLSGKELAFYLKSIKSSQIEIVEIITAPSVKFEADGNAAIINIKLKRSTALGTNGNINLGYDIGTYPKYNIGLNINNRNKKTNIYGSLNVNTSKNIGYFNFYRQIGDTIFDQGGDIYIGLLSITYSAGIEYYLNKKNSLNFNVSGNNSKFDNQKDSKTAFYFNNVNNNVKNLFAGNSVDANKLNNNFNLNYQYSDSQSRVFSINADVDLYNNKSDQLQPNYYYNGSGNVLISSKTDNIISPLKISLYSLKADYEQNFKIGKLSLGVASTSVTTNNVFELFNVNGSNSQIDSTKSNTFKYSENINSAYASFSKNIKKFEFYSGIRVEHNLSKGWSEGNQAVGNLYDSSFKIKNFNLFPNLSLSFTANDKNKFTLIYSRRIDRPSYSDLNPFEFKLDEYTFQRGNTNLRPQYTNNISFNYIYKSTLSATLSYSTIKDVFSILTDTASASKTFLSRKNLADQKLISLNINMPLQFGRYNLFVNTNGYYSAFKANFGLGRELDLEVFSISLNCQQGYKISKTLSAQINSWFNSPSIWQGTFKSKSMGAVDVGIQKTLFNENGKLKFTVSDVFNTFKWSSVSNFAGQYFLALTGNESRMFKVDLSYRFGNTKMKTINNRQNSLQEERKRVQSQRVI